MEVAGHATEIALREPFAMRNRKRNKHGWRKTGYWGKIETATTFVSANSKSAKIVIQDATFAAKVYGANITPKKAKALAIPLTEAAYGRRPKQWNDSTALQLIKR